MMTENPRTQVSTSLGERLKALRSARGAALGRKLSQREVAGTIGVARSYVASCENDINKPGYDMFCSSGRLLQRISRLARLRWSSLAALC